MNEKKPEKVESVPASLKPLDFVLSKELIREKRASRRAKIFFSALFFAYLTVFLNLFLGFAGVDLNGQPEKVAEVQGKGRLGIIEITGEIKAGVGSRTSANAVAPQLQRLMRNPAVKAVVLDMNSPGGSPVQSARINDQIYKLKEKYKKPVVAILGDLCASGCYYIAAAADEIIADKGSLVGSIGVIMPGFGFVDAMHNLGVERRTVAAGSHKSLLDPFQPVNSEERKHMQVMVESIHNQFMDVVKKGRGKKLVGADDLLFSGLIWTGEQAIENGLVDRLGSVLDYAEENKLALLDPPAEKPLDKILRRLKPSISLDVDAEALFSDIVSASQAKRIALK